MCSHRCALWFQVALRQIFVKHAISVADVGKGEVNSAYDGLMALTGIVMPIFWARAYSFFVSPPGWVPGLLRWGPGGAFNLAGVMLLLSWWAVRSADRSTLYVSANPSEPLRLALSLANR